MRHLLLAILLAGCFSASPPDPPSWDSAVFGEGSPAGGSGAIETTTQDIRTSREGDRWVARQESVMSGTGGDAVRVTAVLEAFNGDVDVGFGDGIHIIIEAFGRADSEADAIAALEQVKVSMHQQRGDALDLIARASADENPGRGDSHGASIRATLPSPPATNLHIDTSNGDVEIIGHRGPSALASSSNGAIRYSGDTDLAWLQTTNGEIEILGAAVSIDADTSNGEVGAVLRPVATGTHRFDTSNGEVTIQYQASDAAYDVRADTSNGEATVDVPDGVADGRQEEDEKHVRSSDWDTSEQRLTVIVDSSNGDITVQADGSRGQTGAETA